MQLKQRIKKLESAAGINHSPYCVCHGKLTMEVLPITLDEWKRRADAGEETFSPLPEKCPDCGKPFDRRFITESYAEVKATIDERLRQVEETWRRHHE